MNIDLFTITDGEKVLLNIHVISEVWILILSFQLFFLVSFRNRVQSSKFPKVCKLILFCVTDSLFLRSSFIRIPLILWFLQRLIMFKKI